MAVVKWIGYGLLGLVVTVAAGVGIALAVFDWNDARGFIARQASKALNREVAIDGDLNVRLGDPLRIHVEGLRVANADWSDDKTMAELRVLDLQLRPWPLLRGDFEFPEIRLSGPKLLLEKNREGAANWNFGGPDPRKEAAKETVKPEDRTDLPIIETLVVEEGRLRFRDPIRKIDIDSGVNTAVGGNGDQEVRLEGKGDFAGKPFTLTAAGGSLEYLRDDPKPYPLRVETAIGKTRGKIEGSIAEPVLLEGVDLSVELRGDDLADVFPILGIPVPTTRPYAISGHLGREGDVWRFEGMNGKVGESDLSGQVAVDLGGERPRITGDLTSRKLAAIDLAGFIGASPEGRGDYPTKGRERIIPATEVPLEKLRTADMDVKFRGEHVEAPFSTLDALDARAKLENGRLVLDPLSLGVGGGRVAGTAVLDGGRKTPALDVNLDVRQIKLARLFRETAFAQEMGGTASGRIQLKGQGTTVANILGSSDGKLGVAVDGGRITSYAVKGLKTNILETLGVVLSGDKPLPFNCLVADVTVKDGLVESRALVLDTPETLVTADGTINLRSEAMDMTVLGRAKSPQIFATHVPVHVRGTLGAPDIGVNATESAARGAAAVALGVLLTPLASVLPFLDPGSNEQPHCGELVRNARSPSNSSTGSSGTGKGRDAAPSGSPSGKSQ
ncbi:AsmA family protein [Azospirillum sp. Vi22]|uniref:AsmA family protein n=1 Tax=Azospirillum baldaniorum TaxID=1064539 RepID=UPI00157AD47C|nr:AsmA family protein [Azospirillum baldaniorum]NUB05937.1 AsmA family protein [Azospirillum baldaniorum]